MSPALQTPTRPPTIDVTGAPIAARPAATNNLAPARATSGRFLGRTEPYIWAATRLSLSVVFLWAFFDKLFGLGHETVSAHSWLNGGSPTKGFLSGSIGPFSGIYQNLAGHAVIDWLFMLGLLGIGAALLLGIGMRIAAFAGALLVTLMWSASLPPANHIFMDDHLIYALVLVGIAIVGAGSTLGLGQWWTQTKLVQRSPWLT